VGYRVELDQDRGQAVTEALTVDGQERDPSAGRVFLVDLTADTPVYRQRRLDLPAIIAAPAKPEDVEWLVKEVRKVLADKDPEIRDFLR